ncbi:RCC1 and BTB domain-containing protein 1 [Folsomia candida]|uniref:RCC1 and BTB domain-containing protein 1 n=1 Tax=Folsomia candida TaxID=158441 RepID=A0A226DA18_FOLCA|nr:RCC1 and BTB domain-containing protein 1 [Folsomia candida]
MANNVTPGTSRKPMSQNLLTISKKDLSTWTVFTLLNEPATIEEVERACVIGPLRAIVVTKKDDVIMIESNKPDDVPSVERIKITANKLTPLCGKGIVELYSYGSKYFAALTKSGELYVWGSNVPGQAESAREMVDIFDLFDTSDEDSEADVDYKVEPSSESEEGSEIDENYEVDEDYEIDENHKLDEDNDKYDSESFQIKGLESVRIATVACGNKFIVAMSEDNKIYICGDLLLYLNGTEFKYATHVFTLSKLFEGMNVAGISAGKDCFAAFSKDGKVTCGHSHFLALCDNGEVYVWGNNSFSQLGSEKRRTTNDPILLEFPERVTDICAHPMSNLSACQMKSKIFIWGTDDAKRPIGTKFTNILEPFKQLCNAYCSTVLVVENRSALTTPVPGPSIHLATQVTGDVFFSIDDVRIPGHSDILLKNSPHFKSILEKTQPKEGKTWKSIVVTDVEFTTFHAYLFLVYTGKLNCSKSNMKYILDLLLLCNRYKEEEFVTICDTAVKDGLTVGNAMETFNLLVTYNSQVEVDQRLETLEGHVLKFIVENKKELAAEIANLSETMEPAKLKQIMSALINI